MPTLVTVFPDQATALCFCLNTVINVFSPLKTIKIYYTHTNFVLLHKRDQCTEMYTKKLSQILQSLVIIFPLPMLTSCSQRLIFLFPVFCQLANNAPPAYSNIPKFTECIVSAVLKHFKRAKSLFSESSISGRSGFLPLCFSSTSNQKNTLEVGGSWVLEPYNSTITKICPVKLCYTQNYVTHKKSKILLGVRILARLVEIRYHLVSLRS